MVTKGGLRPTISREEDQFLSELVEKCSEFDPNQRLDFHAICSLIVDHNKNHSVYDDSESQHEVSSNLERNYENRPKKNEHAYDNIKLFDAEYQITKSPQTKLESDHNKDLNVQSTTVQTTDSDYLNIQPTSKTRTDSNTLNIQSTDSDYLNIQPTSKTTNIRPNDSDYLNIEPTSESKFEYQNSKPSQTDAEYQNFK